jgi:hypothetical protein
MQEDELIDSFNREVLNLLITAPPLPSDLGKGGDFVSDYRFPFAGSSPILGCKDRHFSVKMQK